MRFLAYVLLAANLGLFAWILIQPPRQPPEYHPIPVPPGIEPLVLLSERETDTAAEVAAAEDGTTNDPSDVEAEQDVTTDNTEPETPVAVETPAVVADAKPPAVKTEPVCRTVGPLLRKREARALVKQLAPEGYVTTLRDGEVREPSGYWVYMPAMPAREARRIVAELDANGMKDYFIGKQNYISLGIFSRKDKAQLRLDQIKSLGFDAVLDQRYRTRNVYWLDLEDSKQPLLGSQIWQQIQAEHTDIRVQRVSCE